MASLTLLVSACGLRPPELAEFWEARDLSELMVYNIKRNILCETIQAIQDVNAQPSTIGKAIPDDYSVQLQLTLSVAESSSLSPNVSYTRTYPPGSQAGVSIARDLNLGFSGELSSTATRIDTSYSYWRVGRIAAPGANDALCKSRRDPVTHEGSSLLVKSDLGIARFLDDQVKATVMIPSSKPAGKNKPDKIDVYSYDLKFAVVSSGGVSPVFKLVSVAGAGMPILHLNRTRTHELLLTFGPTGSDGFQPSEISLGQHISNQLSSAISRRSIGP